VGILIRASHDEKEEDVTSQGGACRERCLMCAILTAGNAGEEGEDDAADTFGFGEGAFHTFR